jgi:hypothetical protein
MAAAALELHNYGFPVPEHPFYHLRYRLEGEPKGELKVSRIEVDGRRVRDFTVYNNGCQNGRNAFVPKCRNELVVRVDWHNAAEHTLKLKCEDGGGKSLELSRSSRAPDEGGYWDRDWRYYGANVLEETEGLDRKGEPVHLLLGLYADRLTDPAREIRVVGIDPESGLPEELPCQVYGVSTWDKMADKHCQPTTTVELAFLADVPALSRKVFLIFYGNPKAAAPAYRSDLRTRGEGYGLTVENGHYKVLLHPKSGAIDEIHLKQNANVVFDHHLETNGSLHWNPGVYAPPRTWIHASDWEYPAGYATIRGPVFFTTKRSAPLPLYPEVSCSITYTFYAGKPYLLMESVLDVTKDMDVVALRNGEIVLNHNVVREFAWKKPDGDIGSVVIKERPRHPTRGMDLHIRTPWFAFYNRDIPCALAAVNLQVTACRRDRGLVEWEPWHYLHWGPWTYCARPLIYTFATPNPQRVMHVSAGSSYYEKMAFHPCRLGASDEDRFLPVEETAARLHAPLRASVTHLDTDERVPEEWVPPILVSEFEEMGD